MTGDITQWLEGLGLGRYATVFEENAVDFETLPHLSEDDLTELGLPLGHRRRLQAALGAIDETGEGLPLSATAKPEPVPHPAGAERRQLTVLFCDLVGSTELSAKLDPEDMRDVLRAYQEACAKVIGRYDGYVAKFMGDGVYAYFGYPTAHEDDAERAITAGLGIVEAVDKIGRDLAVRIGIATGNVAVGDLIGEGASEEANVVGEAPNLAARLQAIAEPNTVVIGEATHSLAGGMFETTDLGAQNLKGFSEPLGAWRVLRSSTSESRFQATRGEHLTELIGREEELEILLRRWNRVKAGDGQAVFIAGEPGIGKSRLVHALRERIEGEAYYVRVQQCSPLHTHSALFPFIDQTSRAIGLTHEDTNSIKIDKLEEWIRIADSEVEKHAPLLGPILGIDTSERYAPVSVSPQRQKELLFEAFAKRFEGLSSKGPFLYIVEDSHWLDPTSLELLGKHIENAPGRLAVMIIVTYRPEFNAPWVGQANTTLMTLNRLDRTQCAAIVSSISGNFGLSDEIVEGIAQRTDGVPLFVEEMTKAVLETSDDGRSALAIDIPATLQDSLEARLDRLGTAKEVAQIGAVIGRTFGYDLLSHVVRLDDEDLRAALKALIGSGLAIGHGTPPRSEYTFKHALVQDTAYNSLLRKRRTEFHHQIALVMQEKFPEIAESDPETLAHHFTEAKTVDPAVLYWRRAASRAMSRSAAVEAVAHLKKGLDLLATLPPSSARDESELDLQSEFVSPLLAVEGPRSATLDAALDRGYELCKKFDNSQKLFPLLFVRYQINLMLGQSNEVAILAKEFLSRAKQSGDEGLQAVGCRMMGAVCFREGSLTPAQEYLEQVDALYDFEQHRNLFGTDAKTAGLSNQAVVLWLLGYPAQAKSCSSDALTQAQLVNHANSTGISLLLAGIIFSNLLKDYRVTNEHTMNMVDLAEKFGHPVFAQIGRFHSGRSEVLAGRAEDGIKIMKENFSEPDDPTSLIHWSWHATLLAAALGKIGQLEEAVKYLDKALAHAEDDNEGWAKAEVWRVKGDLAALIGENLDAESFYKRALDVARDQSAKSWELRSATRLARLWQSQGKTTEARDLLSPIYNWFTEGFDTADLKEAKALLNELS